MQCMNSKNLAYIHLRATFGLSENKLNLFVVPANRSNNRNQYRYPQREKEVEVVEPKQPLVLISAKEVKPKDKPPSLHQSSSSANSSGSEQKSQQSAQKNQYTPSSKNPSFNHANSRGNSFKKRKKHNNGPRRSDSPP
jgi:hypothetical protein